MNIRLPLIVSLVLVAAMAALSAWAWAVTPDDYRFAVHFGADGRPDRWGGKLEGLAMLPLVALGIVALFAVLPRIDPRNENLARSRQFYVAAWLGVVALLAAVHVSLVAPAFGRQVAPLGWLPVALALLWIVLGNYMGKSRSNFFAGVRTPWTLSSEYSWTRTHRLAGALFVASGVLGLAVHLAGPAGWALPVLVGGAVASSLAAVVASYVYWRRDPERAAQDPGA